MATRILVVDDDAAIRESMKEFMLRAGYPCETAATAEEALELLKQEPMPVVITDIILPGLDGLELTDIIKRHYEIDVIVMTGYSADYSYEEAINKGASDFVFKPIRFGELLLRLRRVLRERQLTQERDRMMVKLQKLAITDGLTKLYNSRHFYSQLKGEIVRSNRYHHQLALLLLDIDLFKNYNDSFGHLQGDKVLVRIGQVIRSCLRKMDSAYRYGGEEFTILLPETGGEEAVTVAQRIRYSVENEHFVPEPGRQHSITVSLGVAEYAFDEDMSTFVQRADKALYMSKANGRNQVSFLRADEAV